MIVIRVEKMALVVYSCKGNMAAHTLTRKSVTFGVDVCLLAFRVFSCVLNVKFHLMTHFTFNDTFYI